MTSADKTTLSLRRRTVLTAAVATIGLAGAASALAQPGPAPVDLQVVDRDTGQVLRAWRHHGHLFVAGEPGARYSLRVINHTADRIKVVMSVDGVNIITGETASYDQMGYVFGPYQAYDIAGWRKSNTEVAAFAFAPLPQSYAARTGRPADVGVIGIAMFKEKAPPPIPAAPPLALTAPRRPTSRDERGPVVPVPAPPIVVPAPAAAYGAPPPPPPPPSGVAEVVVPARRSALTSTYADSGGSQVAAAAETPREAKLGTAHGAREWSVSNIVPFEKATPYPQFVRQIEYDTWNNLRARGVIPPAMDTEHRPRPFPSGPDGQGYVPDPPRLR